MKVLAFYIAKKTTNFIFTNYVLEYELSLCKQEKRGGETQK